MALLIVMLLITLLFLGFLSLTSYEARRGSRFFAEKRSVLDAHIARMTFVFAHVDFEAFVKEHAKNITAKIMHDVAHLTLLLVRHVERLLTGFVRHLRTHHNVPIAKNESSRPFVKAMSDFKEQLKTARPPVSDIQN